LIILMGLLAIVALVGFCDALRLAGPVILAPILGAVGLTLRHPRCNHSALIAPYRSERT
jgi:hypothetical protein